VTAFDTFLPPTEDIERALAAGLDQPVRLKGLERLSGGMVNSVMLADLDSCADGQPSELVLKLSKDARAFSGEAAGLRWLARNTEFPVPKVFAVTGDAEAPFGMLALSRLAGVNLGQARASGGDFTTVEREMAEAVAALHAHTREEFGPALGEERYGTWVEDFGPRFRDTLGKEECQTRLDKVTVARCERIADAVPRLLDRPTPARLVHGDIWATNVIVHCDEAGEWRLSGFVDTSGRFADPEYELAYLLVFHTAGPAFFERYQDFFEIDPGFPFRRLVYNLHTMLIHVWFFGDAHYRASARDLAERVEQGMGKL
jgi:fructosamine-3-kinase